MASQSAANLALKDTDSFRELHVTPAHPYFAARAEGIDFTKPLTPSQMQEVTDVMDKYGVVCFPGQQLNDEQQAEFAQQFGVIEDTPTLVDQERRRLSNMKINDISNLGVDGQILAADDRRRMYNLGNLLWHSDSSFKPTPAYWSMLHARVIPPVGGQTEFIDTRVAWDNLPDDVKAEVKDLVTDHSLIYSRAQMGFGEFSPIEKGALRTGAAAARPPSCGLGPSRALPLGAHRRSPWHADPGGACPHPLSHRVRDAAAVRLLARLGGQRSGDLGQSLHHAPRHALR